MDNNDPIAPVSGNESNNQPVDFVNQIHPVEDAQVIQNPDNTLTYKVTPKIKNKKNLLPIIIGILAATLFFAGIFYLTFNLPGAKNIISPLSNNNSFIDPASIKSVQNPLTGEMYTPDEAGGWQGQRPIGVMINNHEYARQQSGLIDADLVYEIVAEGGITRYLAFFLDTLPEKIGPVRSTREYYLVLVKELGDAMIMHIGWSPQALTAIETWPVRSLARGGAQFWRDDSRINAGIPIEHTAYVDGPELRQLSVDLGWDGVNEEFTVYKFKDNNTLQGTKSSKITIDFWYPGAYSGIFTYDNDSNNYLRSTGYDESNNPIPLIDQESQKQIAIKNLIIQFADEVPIPGDDKSRLEYVLVGSGEGKVFVDGVMRDVTWSKAQRDARTVFYDTNGQEIEFNRGNFWISIVPSRNKEQVVIE